MTYSEKFIDKDGKPEAPCELRTLPKEAQTPEICLAAVRKNCLALQYVREDLITEELCFAAIDSMRYMEDHFDKNFYNSRTEFVLDAIDIVGKAVVVAGKTKGMTQETCDEFEKDLLWLKNLISVLHKLNADLQALRV